MKTIGILLGGDPRKHSGGVEKVIFEISNKLITKYKISYVFASKKDFHETDGKSEYYGVRSLSRPPFSRIFLSSRLGKFKFDLIIDNLGVVKLFNNIYPQTKVIQICHSVVGEALKNMKFKNIILKIGYMVYYFTQHLLWKKTYKKADIVIAAPKSAGEGIIKHYKIKRERFVNIYNGIDFLSEWITPYNNGILKVIFISNNHAWKGIDILERMAIQLRDYNVIFNIVGAPYNNRYKLKNIVCLGKLVGENKYNEIKNSDVVFMASNYEGQSLVVIEAMSSGCIPLVSLNTHADVVEGTELESFVSKNNEVSFYVDRIKYLIDNPDKINRLKELSRSLVSEYLWDKQSEKYLEVVDNLLK